jgi:hypothetical protein
MPTTTNQEDSTEKSLPHKKLRSLFWLKLILSFTVVIGGLLILMPFAIQYAAQKWLQDNGADEAVLDDVDFNPFTAELVIKGLSVTARGKAVMQIQQAAVGWDWLPLWDKHIFITRFSLIDADLHIEQLKDGTFVIGSVALPGAKSKTDNDITNEEKNDVKIEETKEPWGFALRNFTIQDTQIQYVSEQLKNNTRINQITLHDLFSWQPTKPAQLNTDLTINGSPLHLQSKLYLFESEPRIQADVQLDKLELAKFATTLDPNVISDLAGDISMDYAVKAVYRDNRYLDLLLDGELQVSSLSMQRTDLTVAQDQLSWKGHTELKLPALPGKPVAHTKGELNTKGFHLTLSDQHMQIDQGALWWKGEVTYTSATDSKEQDLLQVQADSTLNNLLVQAQDKHINLLDAEKIEMRNISVGPAMDVGLGRIEIANLNALAPTDKEASKGDEPRSILRVGNTVIENVSFQQPVRLNIAAIRLASVDAYLKRQKDERLYLIDTLTSAPQATEEQQVEEQQPEQSIVSSQQAQTDDENPILEQPQAIPPDQPLTLQIALIEIKDDSQIVIEDKSVTPPYKTTLKPLLFKLENLDNSKPEQPSQIEIKTSFDQYSKLTLNGSVKPFTDKLSAELSGKIETFDLPPLSSYTSKFTGYTLKRGHLNADISIHIDEGKLDIENKLLLSNLNLDAKDPDQEKKITEQLAMPLDVALDLLRDKNNNIELRIPVQGDLDAPDVDISNVVNKAMTKALRSAAISYVTNALQPLGTIITVGKIAGKVAAPRFEPVTFTPGENTLAAQGRQYLDKLAGLLQERPKIRFSLCGIATQSDRKVLQERERQKLISQQKAVAEKQAERPGTEKTLPPVSEVTIKKEQLTNLATQRSEAVRNYFNRQHSIDVKRLFLCRPEIDTDEEAKPRVDIQL